MMMMIDALYFSQEVRLDFQLPWLLDQNNSKRESTSPTDFLPFGRKYNCFRYVLGYKTIAIVQSCESFVLEDDTNLKL